jgi:hypothetical protein
VWILTAIVVTGALIPLTFVGLTLFSIGMAESGMGNESPRVSVDETRQQIKDAFGDDLDRVEVREVTQSYGDAPFPFSALAKSSGTKAVYMEYQLRGSDVVVAGLTGDLPIGGSPGPADMIPTKGSLASRMTLPQFKRLLVAYAAETKAPLGAVRRYNDPSPSSSRGGSEATVTIGSQDYAAKELWSATEGMLVKGDEVTDDIETRFERTAHVFREDPVTGEFKSLGTETEPSFAD